jgi:hypothetical protein
MANWFDPGIAGGARGAHRRDAREPAPGRRAAGRLRRARRPVRDQLRRPAGRSQRRGGQPAEARRAAARRLRAPRRLERGLRPALAGGRSAARRPAAAAVDPRRRPRPLCPGGRLLAAGPRPRRDHRLRHRGPPLHRSLPGLHHHRAGRVDRRHGRDGRGRRSVLHRGPLSVHRVPRDRRVVVAVLRRRRRALAPGHELVRGPGPPGARRLPICTPRSCRGSSPSRWATTC